MKQICKKIKALVMLLITGIMFVGSIFNVSAAAKTITLGEGEKLDDYLAGVGFNTKVTSTGEYVYCLDFFKSTAANVEADLVSELDAGMAYILTNGYPKAKFTGDNKKDYYITQAAVWWYLDETTGSTNLNNSFKISSADPNGIRPYIKGLVTKAIAAKKAGYPTASLSLDTKTSTMKLDSKKEYYVSDEFAVTSDNLGSYTVTLTDAPEGTMVVATDGSVKNKFSVLEKFIVKVPADTASEATKDITVTVSSPFTVNKAYKYQPRNSTMQSITPAKLQADTKTLKDSAKLTISTTTVTITKLDRQTNKALAGATLVLKDSYGKEIARWKSTTNAHVIRNLANGKYAIVEEAAPTGYKKLDKAVEFTISDTNKNVNVKVYNDVQAKSVITISKLDGNTGAVLTGAMLEVKNSSGKVIARFYTKAEPYVLTNIANDTYTITEVKAPSGYKMSSEVVKVVIDDTNRSQQVNFYNYPKVEVPDTASARSIIMTIIGTLLLSSTVIFIRKYAK